MNRHHVSALLFSLVISLFASPALLRAQTDAATPDATRLVTLLDQSGYNYSKVEDGFYQVDGTGKNYKEFTVQVALSGDIVLVMAKLADRKDLPAGEALPTRLLELNHHFDSVKLAYSDDILYIRMDNHLRLMDVDEMKYMIEQIANAADEAYPEIAKVEQSKGKRRGK